jgi:pilus assembly protein CpaB
MKSKTFVMMFVAIGCGLVAAYLTARITAKQAAPDTVPVLVAKEKIKAGEMIKEPEKLFVEMRYPAGSTPNAISSPDDLKGKMVNKTVQPGQWLTPDDLSSNFGIELPKGYYALAIKVAPDTAASGFILPKSRVNVVATIRPAHGQTKSKVVTILQDVLVLAVDTMSLRPEDKLAVNQLNTALLAVKPADSQKLSLAQSMGELRLVLRSHDDDNKVPLPPLDQLETDSGIFVDGQPNETTFKLAVAKQDLDAGTEIDDPERLFEVKSFPTAPEKAIPAEDIRALKGKTVKTPLFKDTVVTAKHFDERGTTKVELTPDVQRHVLFIQNGGNAPIRHVYENGLTQGEDAKGTALPPSPTGPTAADPKAADPKGKTKTS